MSQFDTRSFSESLAQGMGMGLHVRQLQTMHLYREQQLAERERALEIAQDRLYQQGQLGNRRLDITQGWHDQQGDLGNRRLDIQRDRVDEMGAYHGGLLDIRGGELDRRTQADNQKQLGFQQAGDMLYGTMHPSQDDLGQPGPELPVDQDIARQQFMQAGPRVQMELFKADQRKKAQQLAADTAHMNADKSRSAVANDPNLSPEQKGHIMESLTDKALQHGLPSWAAHVMFPAPAHAQVPNGAERSLQGLSEEQFQSEVKNATDPNQAWRYTPQYQTMVQAEANRRAKAPKAAPAGPVAPPVSQSQIDQMNRTVPGGGANAGQGGTGFFAMPGGGVARTLEATLPAGGTKPQNQNTIAPPSPTVSSPAVAAPSLDQNLIQRLHGLHPEADDATILQMHDQMLQGGQPPAAPPGGG